jgi:hypothetical protein
MRQLPILALVLALGACSSSTVASLRYVPPMQVPTVAAASVSTVTAIDQRKEAPARLATIMGGFGNPLKTLDTAKPVKEEIADAFTAGLRARGLLSPSGEAPFRLVLVIRKFDADMIVGRTARIDMTMSLVDSAGRTVHDDSAVDSQSDMKFMETGIFADIADMQVLAETVLQRTVDRLLDNPRFRAAAARSGAQPT